MRGSVWSYRPGQEPAPFPLSQWGLRGYDEMSVDTFVQQLIRDRDAADQQIADLRAEVDRLHRYIRRQWAAVAAAESASAHAAGRPDEPGPLVSPAAQARAVLNQAQEIAEHRLAEADARLRETQLQVSDQLARADRQAEAARLDAEQQAGLLVSAGAEAAARRLHEVDTMAEQVLAEARQEAVNRLARARYEDIVVRAHQRADRAAEMALAELGPGASDPAGADRTRTRAELEMTAAYLRTFAKVSRAGLQTALEVTAGEFDQLLGASAGREPGARPPEPVAPEPLPARPRSIVLPDTEAAGLATITRLR